MMALGSNPIALVVSMTLVVTTLHFVNKYLVLLAESIEKKEKPMGKTLTATILAFANSLLVTIWAIGVSSVVGQLSA